MTDQERTRQQLIAENEELRRRIVALEGIDAERRRAENELAKSEGRYRALAESTRDIIYILDRQGTLLYANQAASQCIGIPCDEIAGRQQADLFPPEMARNHMERIGRVLATGEALEQDEEFHFGPEAVWLRVHLLPLRDDAGQMTSVLGVCHDITHRKRTEAALQEAHDELEQRVEERTAELTKANEQLRREVGERRRAEQALRESEDKYRTLVETSPDAVIMTDLQGRISYASRRVLEMHGSERLEEVLGRKPLDFFAPEDHRKFLINLQRNTDDGVLRNMEYTFLRKDGTRLAGEASAAVFRDAAGNATGFVAIVRDVTERKRAQAALQQSHDELRAIYDGMFDGLLVVDVESKRYLKANASICRMLGYSEAELLSLTTMDIHPPEEVPIALERIHARAEGRLVGHVDTWMRRKDGSLRHADVVGSRLTYAGRSCVVSFFRDTTERRQAQAALERERQSLWRMLQASDHERQVISYDIHDGLAQYLAAAGMQFQVHDALRESNPEKARKAYETAVELVRQSHSEARRLISEVRPPVIDENGIEMAISHLVHEHRRHGGPAIKFDSDVQFGRLPAILESAIYRIIQEALTNACRHSQTQKVAVTLAQQGQEVYLEVRDWGIGFDPQSIEPGHFGLEGIRQRVRLLGARLTIESTRGLGTTLQVLVPIVEKQDEGEALASC